MSAIAESLSITSLDQDTLLELSRRTDPVGVLSIYVHAQPGSSPRAEWIDLKNRLAELERGIAREGPPERAQAINDGIRRLGPELGWLLDPEQRGRGRHLTDTLVRALPPGQRETALRDPRLLVRLDPEALEDTVTEQMFTAHSEFEQRLIARFREDAQGAGAAALGLSEVVGALNQARVAHLVYDPYVRYQGSIGDDGSLYADCEVSAMSRATADPRLTERIVERALETGARVTPVEGAASDGLAEASGIAALLRW